MQKRLYEIDGIRGWAALVVLIFHLAWEVFGNKFPEYHSFYFKFILDGPLAVCVFFILSGDALSNGYLRQNSYHTLARLVIKRYFRLTGPILLSCVIVYFLMKLNLTFNSDAGHIVGREDWLGTFLPFDVSFFDMLKYALLKVYTEHSVSNSYNPFLWPMSIELYGSFFIFGILFSLRTLRNPLFVVSMIAGYFWLLGSFYSLFFIGLSFSLLREAGFFAKLKKSPQSKLSLVALVLLIAADSILEKYWYKSYQVFILLAASVVFLIYSNGVLTSFFSNRMSRYLGKISFPLYLSHFSVIISYTSWAIKYCHKQGILDFWHSGLIISSSMAIAILVAEVFARLEEVYLHKLDVVAVNLLTTPDNHAQKLP